MKRIFCIVIAVVLWASIGCKNSNNNQQSNTVVDTVPFYPINSFVIEEIRKAKDSSYTISKKTIVNRGKADSVQISNEDFAQLAQIFLKKILALHP